MIADLFRAINFVDTIVSAVVLLIVGWFVFRAIKFGGFRGAAVGARVVKTVGEVQAPHRFNRSQTVVVKVLALDGAPEKAVGLEFVTKSTGYREIHWVSLSAGEAKHLASLIQSAVSGP